MVGTWSREQTGRRGAHLSEDIPHRFGFRLLATTPSPIRIYRRPDGRRYLRSYGIRHRKRFWCARAGTRSRMAIANFMRFVRSWFHGQSIAVPSSVMAMLRLLRKQPIKVRPGTPRLGG